MSRHTIMWRRDW